MARKSKDRELTKDRDTYVMTCGSEMKGEQRRPKIFRLGSDARIAQKKAAIYRHWWQTSSKRAGVDNQPFWKSGQAVWEAEYLELANRYASTVDGQVETERALVADYQATGHLTAPTSKPAKASGSKAAARPLPAGTMTLKMAIDAYGLKLDEDVRTTDRVEANATRQKNSLKAFVRFLTDVAYNPDADKKLPKHEDQQAEYFKAMFKDASDLQHRALAEIGYDQCKATVTNLKQRRVSGFAPYTIRDTVAHTKQFFDWCEEAGHWKPTFNTAKVLQVDTAKLMTLQEVTELNSGRDVFTVEELTTLYTKANDSQKLWLLLGCNLVCTQQQISDLMTDNIDLEEAAVNFVRGKTRVINKGRGVSGNFKLWEETVELLAARMATTPDNKQNLALLTEEGQPVVGSIKLAWDKLLTKAGALRPDDLEEAKAEARKAGVKFVMPEVRWLPFSTLRKTISTFVKELAGEAVQQQALTHAPTTVAGKHYSGKTKCDNLEDAMQHVHDVCLKPMFDASRELVTA